MVTVAQQYQFTKAYQIVHLKWTNLMICKAYLNEPAKRKEASYMMNFVFPLSEKSLNEIYHTKNYIDI